MRNLPLEELSLKVLQRRHRLSIRLNHVIVPIDYAELNDALQKRGSTVQRMPRLPVGTGANVEPLGVFAQFGDATVDIDIGRGILGVDSGSPRDALVIFHQLMEILQKDLGVNP